VQPFTWELQDVLPHRGRSILLHEIAAWDDEAVVARVRITDAVAYWTDQGVPSFVGLEYMAQACGAWAGCRARSRGEPARIGFLLGSRDYEATVPYFKRDEVLTITARLDFQDGKVGSFNCTIESNGTAAATARITVYQPDPEELT
jgi:predicted hotdog family 3-hydroxylacyl-ACP dehydratase